MEEMVEIYRKYMPQVYKFLFNLYISDNPLDLMHI